MPAPVGRVEQHRPINPQVRSQGSRRAASWSGMFGDRNQGPSVVVLADDTYNHNYIGTDASSWD